MRHMRALLCLLTLALAFVLSAPAFASVKVNAFFTDNAVVQRRKPIAVWGTAEPDEMVVVRLGPSVGIATADKEGAWMVKLKPMEAGGPYELNIKGKDRLIAKNIYVGEVWLCSGQSNMVLPTSFAKKSKEDIDNGTNPNLHLFTVEDALSQTPIKTFSGKWQTATPETIRDFSAVAYYFGRTIQSELKIPVGIICSAYAGTPIKVWMSEEAVTASHDTSQVNLPENFIAIREAFDKKVAEWKDLVAEARAKGQEEPAKPVLPPDFFAVSSAFYGMINPLIPYTIKGVCWYQGESDTDYPFRWHKMFACMVDDWRQRWGDPKMPFIYVQLPSYDKKAVDPTESLWAELREGQLEARRVPYAYMSCCIDTARGKDIDMHPREKRMVGMRLGNVALATVYNVSVPYSGPLYDSMEVVGNKIKLKFRFTEGGLTTRDGTGLLRGFQIAGVDKRFFNATAEIVGDSVLVSSDKVPYPVAVRYGWAANPDINLCNKASLPAVPFRTDKWVHQWGKKKKNV